MIQEPVKGQPTVFSTGPMPPGHHWAYGYPELPDTQPLGHIVDGFPMIEPVENDLSAILVEPVETLTFEVAGSDGTIMTSADGFGWSSGETEGRVYEAARYRTPRSDHPLRSPEGWEGLPGRNQ